MVVLGLVVERCVSYASVDVRCDKRADSLRFVGELLSYYSCHSYEILLFVVSLKLS